MKKKRIKNKNFSVAPVYKNVPEAYENIGYISIINYKAIKIFFKY